MLDAYFAAACVGLLIALAILSQAYVRLRKIADGRKVVIDEFMADVAMLERELKAARKNDNRDNKGRYAKATA